MSKILVTGGAGYIGSHTALALIRAGYEVVVYDNLSTGKKEAVLPPARLEIGDLGDIERLDRLLRRERFRAIIHFAASIIVPESVTKPLKYYQNNTSKTIGLVDLAVKNCVPEFVFSSTAAVYGVPETVPVNESAPLDPINPYGRSKLMNEWVLRDAHKAHPDFRYAILRYFNVAGADPEGRLGQETPNATHLIKVACQAALGQREVLPVYGTDYPTRDGTGERDYIHVSDLANVHVKALEYLEGGNQSRIFNCGYGHGYTVREIIEAVREVSGKELNVKEMPRRPGDPARLIADPSRLSAETDWRPRLNDIRRIVANALDWEKESAGRKESH
ncbi:MAG: UDP-glucose 4-epimerase GalE [Desulfonatronovibrionaceae bacterium]